MFEYSLIFIFVLLSFLFNGSMDAIDHYKGAAPLKDLWHLLKYFFIGSIGCSFFFLSRNFDIVGILGFIVMLPIGKFILWDHIYYNYYKQLIELDNKVKISTGIDFLDKWLGFHN